MATPTHIQQYGDQLVITHDDGVKFVAYRGPAGLWIVGKGDGPGPEPGTGEWKPPFNPAFYPAGDVTPGRNFDPPNHYGIDYGYGAAQNGAQIFWRGPSVKVYDAGSEIIQGGGNGVFLTVPNSKTYGDVLIEYSHMLDPSPLISKIGQMIPDGTLIGLVGNTGNSFGAHLHQQVRRLPDMSNANSVDPVLWYAAQNA